LLAILKGINYKTKKGMVMLQYITKAVSYIFIFIIFYFVYRVMVMIYLDIKVMSRKKSGLPESDAYLKLINLRSQFDFLIHESYNIGEEETIGRSRKNSIKIDDPFLSQFHARIFKKGNDYYIEDLGSTNGTKLNGEPLGDEAVQLMDNDKIEFGRIAFLFVMPYANKD